MTSAKVRLTCTGMLGVPLDTPIVGVQVEDKALALLHEGVHTWAVHQERASGAKHLVGGETTRLENKSERGRE